MKHTYIECRYVTIPADVRFDTPTRNQGQMIEVSYGGFCRSEHDDGDIYKRVVDRTNPHAAPTYYQLAKAGA